MDKIEIIYLIVYLISIVGCYKLFQKLEWFQNGLGFVIMSLPVINTLYTIVGWWFIILEKVNWNKFFNKF